MPTQRLTGGGSIMPARRLVLTFMTNPLIFQRSNHLFRNWVRTGDGAATATNANTATYWGRKRETGANVCFNIHDFATFMFVVSNKLTRADNADATTNRWWWAIFWIGTTSSANICFDFHRSFLPSLTRRMRDYSGSIIPPEFLLILRIQSLCS